MAKAILVSSAQPQIIAAAAYRHGKRVAEIQIDEAGDWAKREGHIAWIGLHEPESDLLRKIQLQFDLHPLAIEDALKAHQRPKLELYGESLFVVARTAQIRNEEIAFGETHLFVGRGYVVSVRHGPSSSYASVRQRCEAAPDKLANGEDYILYAILDFIVDNYAPVLELIEVEATSIEEALLSPAPRDPDMKGLYQLRRSLLRLRNAAVPLIEVCRRLEQPGIPGIDAGMYPLFRDISDHLRLVQEQVEGLRETLDFAFQAGVITGQAHQTEITRKLAAWAAILAVPTAIAGIYGMNFDVMPELRWRYGYAFVLASIAIVCGTLFWRFRRNRWL